MSIHHKGSSWKLYRDYNTKKYNIISIVIIIIFFSTLGINNREGKKH